MPECPIMILFRFGAFCRVKASNVMKINMCCEDWRGEFPHSLIVSVLNCVLLKVFRRFSKADSLIATRDTILLKCTMMDVFLSGATSFNH